LKEIDVPEWLEPLIEHEAYYFAFAGELEKTPVAWFFRSEALFDYGDANHAFNLRDDGRGPTAVADAVIRYFKRYHKRIIADVDMVAEAQGIGGALRQRGIMPVVGSMSLMYYPHSSHPPRKNPQVQVREIPKEGRVLEHWIDIVGGNEDDSEKWRRVARAEALFTSTRIYMAFLEGIPVGTCSLISGLGWGRIESVMTIPLYRRMGVATSLVCKTIADSLVMGNTTTYLFTETGGTGEALYKNMGFESLAQSPLRRHLE